MCTADVKELLALAATLATSAGAELLARQAAFSIDGPAVETKSSASDPVTAADRASEKLITDGLAAARPEDGLLGEEGASKPTASGITWVIDPLDGTVNYLYGRPDWAVSIAAEDETGALVGVVHQPRTGITWQAVRDGGATRERRTAGVAGVPGPRGCSGEHRVLVSGGAAGRAGGVPAARAPRSTGCSSGWVRGPGSLLGRRWHC